MREFLKDVWMHGGEESRAITPENIGREGPRRHVGQPPRRRPQGLVLRAP
jgi:hypothetical protein